MFTLAVYLPEPSLAGRVLPPHTTVRLTLSLTRLVKTSRFWLTGVTIPNANVARNVLLTVVLREIRTAVLREQTIS